MSSSEPIIADIIATRPPPEVANPQKSNPFALDDGKATKDEHMVRRLSVVPDDDPEKTGDRSSSVVEREMYPTPTAEEAQTLRKVSDSIPIVAYSLCIVECAERASYYGVQTVFSNFMQYPLPKGGNGAGAPPKGTQETAGALGKGPQFANAIGLLFLFMAYVIPIFGGWLADTKIGRYKTILIGVLVCGVSHVIMVCGAIPSVLQTSNAIAPFMVSLWLLALGAGIFKPNIAPTILDQYRHQKPYTKVLKSGEKVIMDPEATVQRIMLIFYGMINVGAFFAVATTFSEKYVGYWLAFLTPGIVYFALPFLLWFLNNKLVKYPPDGSVLNKVAKIAWLAFKHNKKNIFKRSFLDAAKPSELRERGVTMFRNKAVDWTDKDVEDLKRTIIACMIFLYYPIWIINDGGVGSLATIQGSTMTTNGAPNDLLGNINPLVIIITIPILSHVIYPYLRKRNIRFGRISRIMLGFTLAWISGIIGAIVQWKIYQTSPCGYHALTCAEANGQVSPLSIWIQVPNTALGAISECFVNVTGYELAYARAPPGMKAVVMSFFLFTTALSYALGEVLIPVVVDPYLVWAWAAPAIALFAQSIIFWFRYKHLNHDEFMTYEDPLDNKSVHDGSDDEGVAPGSEQQQRHLDEKERVPEKEIAI